jgi:hypothetical protein
LEVAAIDLQLLRLGVGKWPARVEYGTNAIWRAAIDQMVVEIGP